jgi:hypothetical protein
MRPRDIRTAVVLVAPQMAVEEIAVQRHRDRQDFDGPHGAYSLEAREALLVVGVAGTVAVPAYARLAGRWHRHQPRTQREQ